MVTAIHIMGTVIQAKATPERHHVTRPISDCKNFYLQILPVNTNFPFKIHLYLQDLPVRILFLDLNIRRRDSLNKGLLVDALEERKWTMHIRSLSTLVWIKNIQTLSIKVFLIHSTVFSVSVFQQDSSHKEGLKKYTAGIMHTLLLKLSACFRKEPSTWTTEG